MDPIDPHSTPLPWEEHMRVCDLFRLCASPPAAATVLATATAAAAAKPVKPVKPVKELQCAWVGCNVVFRKMSNFKEHFMRHHIDRTSPDYIEWKRHSNKVQAARRRERVRTDHAFAMAERRRSSDNRRLKRMAEDVADGSV
ncbi:hypothetical protein T484DRAFT_1755655 [Baffinella frigidus]|nr:hypothetical protein T484DRAFT_1755655 [Cryptophyta sp. CCMP2293]